MPDSVKLPVELARLTGHVPCQHFTCSFAGTAHPGCPRYLQEGEQSVIRRLFVLASLSIIFIGGSVLVRPAQSASAEPCTQDHATWLTPVLKRMETIRPGMTRWDVLKVFRTEESVGPNSGFSIGGVPSPGFRETFVSQDCPYFKIDIEFAGHDSIPNRDVIVKVSKPYVQFAITN